MQYLKFMLAKAFVSVRDNDVDSMIPEMWANESLAILEENMVVAQLVHRDFEEEFAKYGDIVHTRRPGEFQAKRKTPNDDVTVQDATSTDVQVPLNQHIHVSFLIRDGEESKSFKDLVEVYLSPAMLAQSRIVDRILLGQFPLFLTNSYGGLGTLTSSNAQDRILGTRNKMNQNKAYMDLRQMILTPNTETTFLNLALFTQAQQVGDEGTALREAWLGRKFGFNMYMAQNMSDVATGQTTVLGAVNHSGGYAAGTTTMTVNVFASAITIGSWFTVAGDDTPQQITSGTSLGSAATAITFAPGLRSAVSNSAVITVQTGATTVNASYAAGWSKDIAYTGGSTPIVGQFITFGVTVGGLESPTTNPIYTIVSLDTTNHTILLDRPLELAVVSGVAINYGPSGSYNLAFHRNAMALVVRPLAMPKAGTGALSAVVNHNGLSMRATITYNGTKQGHLVTLDMLLGVAMLDTNLGAVLLG